MVTEILLLFLTTVHLLTFHTFAAHFIIVGGGTCGLLLANRLSADPSHSVTVIESGPDERNNPNITDIQSRFGVRNTPVDWAYQSEPQDGLNERSTKYHAGKLLGGTSMINAMMYVRPDAALVDTWPAGGRWRDLWPYFLQTERFEAQTATQAMLNVAWEPQFHGRSGDVDVCYPFELANGTFGETAQKAWQELDVTRTIDANGGLARGFFPRQMTVRCHTELDRYRDAQWKSLDLLELGPLTDCKVEAMDEKGSTEPLILKKSSTASSSIGNATTIRSASIATTAIWESSRMISLRLIWRDSCRMRDRCMH